MLLTPRLATKLELGYMEVLSDLDLDKLEVLIKAANKVHAHKFVQDQLVRRISSK